MFQRLRGRRGQWCWGRLREYDDCGCLLMQIGDKKRWWNRRVPIGRIGLVVLLVLGVMWVAPYFFDGTASIVWGVAHRTTATYRGRSLKIPLMWRQEEIPHGQRTISLSRARWGQLFAFEKVSIYDDTASPQDPEQAIKHLRTMEDQIGSINTDVYVSRNKDVAARYVCIASRRTQLNRLRIDCVSRDGRWTAILDGYGSDISDFQMVLNNLSRMGDPLPW